MKKITFIIIYLLPNIGFQGLFETTAIETTQIFHQPNHGTIFAGVSIKKITPDLNRYNPIYLAGFNRGRKATGIHDDLWSRCCCIRINGTTIAIVSVDVIGIMYPEYQKIISKLPDYITLDNIIITSTHNHEGPDTIGLWGPDLLTGVNLEWYNEAMDHIADSITEAYISMKPAGIKIGHTEAPGFSRDSRDPQCIDEQIETFQLIDQNETPIATMIFYGSHPEILWNDNSPVTSDYPNYIYRYVENKTGGTAILVIGAIGGLITPNVRNHTFNAAKQFGESIASLALTSLQNTTTIWNTEMRIASRELFIPLTNPIFRLTSILRIIYRPLYHVRRDILTAVSVIELGENGSLAQIVTAPGEDFPENWLELKEKLHAKHRILIGLGMDELGYIVPYEDFDWKKYEESMSASKLLDPIIHQCLKEMITKMN